VTLPDGAVRSVPPGIIASEKYGTLSSPSTSAADSTRWSGVLARST
jgi:hypothetical protein